MSKSVTEQFQIKKKRKHHICEASIASNTTAVVSALPVPTTNKELSIERFIANIDCCDIESSIKGNFSDFQFDSECLKHHPLHFKPITAVDDTADIFIESICIPIETAEAAAGKSLAAATPQNNVTPVAALPLLGTNCLRDRTQVEPQATLPIHRKHSPVSSSSDTMPLQHGFYAKGALASKRALKSSLKVQQNSSTLHMTNGPASSEAKRLKRTQGTTTSSSTAVNDSDKHRRTQSFISGHTANNLQLSYLLGESLARHGRLQEAFDIYALIASEQPKGFIPLEKLNILATALLEHIRILSNNSKKGNDANDDNGSNLTDDTQQVNSFFSTTAPSSTKCATAWQMAATSLTTSSYNTAVKPVTTELLSTTNNSTLDLQNPSREITRIKSPSLSEDYDPLVCPLCRDILRCPVTANCGHTFCRQCCETITMCNICHLKFPRWQKEELANESTSGKHFVSLSTATSTTTSSSSNSGNIISGGILTSSVPLLSNPQQQPALSISSNAIGDMSSGSVAISNRELPRLRIVTSPLSPSMAAPTTVTTTTIACTTDTATTTMASTTSSTLSSVGRAGGSNSSDNMKFMPDVLVRRLVEKWWSADLQARKILETATSYMHLNLLDDALKFCNVSLEKAPSNFKSLLLRAEVLRKMNHYQSSLADVDNALKSRYTSAKAHYLRSLALSELSRYEEALYEICLAINMDKSTNLSRTELFQHDLTKILQKLLSQTPKCIKLDLMGSSPFLRSKYPYGIYPEHRLKRRNLDMQEDESMQICEEDDFLSSLYSNECEMMLADDDVLTCRDFLNCAEKRTMFDSIARRCELALKRQTSRKHFRRKWMHREMELLPSIDVESARCSGQFRNVLERLQQEFVRLKKIESSPEYALKQLITVSPSLIDTSDFDCVLCCRTFWKPVVTPCGHTYCLVCLDRCMDYTSSCPLCMSPLVEPSGNMVQGASSPVPLILTKRPVTKFLEAAMKRFIPDSYNKRLRQEMVLEPSVPIFICTTAFPHVPCPLFVYEPRYRLMVRRAVESGDKQFGIVQPHSGKTRYYDYGCMLDIRDCVLLGDGCSILSTMGCRRFKILTRNEKDGYETAKVEYIHDETITMENLSYVGRMHEIVLKKAKAWYESLGGDLKHEILQSYGEMPLVEENWSSREDGPAWAWWIIALLPLTPQLKVDILATTSLEKRLRAIEKTIHSMPGSCHYQGVSQNCNVSVVVHNQQHHPVLNGDTTGEDQDDLDMDNEHHGLNDGDEEDGEDGEETGNHLALGHHIQNLGSGEEIEDDDIINGSILENHEFQDHTNRPHRRHHHRHQLHHPLQADVEHFDNVENIDECCQRTTTNALVQEDLVNGHTEDLAEGNPDSQHHRRHHHHHRYENHHHAAHSLLL
ncbi:uncharacterized protein LOC142233004 [Haematobia irritans]|uniref:uncharacterized protein LOC142233004 n=1 Tax=Haematobia irritans TaxID=7368 RepID=UPI003F4FD7F7